MIKLQDCYKSTYDSVPVFVVKIQRFFKDFLKLQVSADAFSDLVVLGVSGTSRLSGRQQDLVQRTNEGEGIKDLPVRRNVTSGPWTVYQFLRFSKRAM